MSVRPFWKLAIKGSLVLALSLITASNSNAAESKAYRLTPYIALSETYNDNITFLNEDPIGDFITTLTAGLEAKYETHLSALQMAGNLHYNVFASHDEFTNVSGDFSAEWKQELSKYDRLTINEYYLHTDEPISFADAFNSRVGRFTFQMNRVSVNYEHDFTSQWSGRARYANELAFFSSDFSENNSLNTAGIGALYHFSSRLDFMVDYDYEIRDFDDSGSATDHIVTAGVRSYITEWLYVDVKAGVDMIESYDGENLTEPRFEAKITDEINETTTLDLEFEKKHSLTSYTDDVFDHWQINSSLKKQWTERMRSTFAVFYGSGQYVASNTENDFLGANASLSYDLTKNWRGTIKYSYTNLDSTDQGLQYEKNVVFVGVTCRF